MLAEEDLRVITGLQIISSDAAHVFDDHCVDLAGFDIRNHALPFGTLKIAAGPAVVCVMHTIVETVLSCVISKNTLLRYDGITFSGKFIVTR